MGAEEDRPSFGGRIAEKCFDIRQALLVLPRRRFVEEQEVIILPREHRSENDTKTLPLRECEREIMAVVPHMQTAKEAIQLLFRDGLVIPRQLIDDRVRKQHEICLLPHIADVMALLFSLLPKKQDLSRSRRIKSG